MSTTILLPSPLRVFADGARQVPARGATVGESLADLAERYPALRRHLYADSGELRGFVNVFVNASNVRDLNGAATPVRDGDTLTIIPSIAGG